MTIIWHNHHIIPKHMGGTDAPENLIKVNIAMHAFLHKCLYEEHGCWQDDLAQKVLSGSIPFAEARRIAQRQANLGNKHCVGRIVSESTREKLRKANLGKPKSEESKKKMSEYWLGRKKDASHVAAIRKANTGKKRSEETKQRMREAQKHRRQLGR